MAYEACLKAGRSVEEGSVGAGVGATVGKLFGVARAMKGGVGTSSVVMPDGTIVGALVVVNAFGDILDIATGRIIAGARCAEDSSRFRRYRRLPQGRPGSAGVRHGEHHPCRGCDECAVQ